MTTPLHDGQAIAEVTLDFADISLSGQLTAVSTPEAPNGQFLQLFTDEGPETVSTNLAYYGLHPDQNLRQFWIKDWSEHAGLAASIAAAVPGTQIVATADDIGPYRLTAHLIQLP